DPRQKRPAVGIETPGDMERVEESQWTGGWSVLLGWPCGNRKPDHVFRGKFREPESLTQLAQATWAKIMIMIRRPAPPRVAAGKTRGTFVVTGGKHNMTARMQPVGDGGKNRVRLWAVFNDVPQHSGVERLHFRQRLNVSAMHVDTKELARP